MQKPEFPDSSRSIAGISVENPVGPGGGCGGGENRVVSGSINRHFSFRAGRLQSVNWFPWTSPLPPPPLLTARGVLCDRMGNGWLERRAELSAPVGVTGLGLSGSLARVFPRRPFSFGTMYSQTTTSSQEKKTGSRPGGAHSGNVTPSSVCAPGGVWVREAPLAHTPKLTPWSREPSSRA